MGEVTNEQVNLDVAAVRGAAEPRLREAREWFSANFHAKTAEELDACLSSRQQGKRVHAHVLSYWEMVASIVNRGLIEEISSSKAAASMGCVGKLKP